MKGKVYLYSTAQGKEIAATIGRKDMDGKCLRARPDTEDARGESGQKWMLFNEGRWRLVEFMDKSKSTGSV